MRIYFYYEFNRDGYTIREDAPNVDIQQDHFISQTYLDDHPLDNQFFLTIYNREIIEDGDDIPNVKKIEVTLSEFNNLKNFMA